MKNRDEFIQSVWEKSERAMAEERKQKARRRQAGGLAAIAACLTLVIGITSAGGAQELMAHLLGGASADEAIIAEDQETFNSALEAAASDDSAAVSSPTHSADSAEDLQVALDGASPGMAQLSDEDFYDALRKETAEAGKSKDNDFMGYFCLPIGVVIEDSTGSVVVDTNTDDGNEEKLILMYMNWFYGLPEDQVLTTEEFESLKEIPTGYYKFTMDQSLGADTEGVDRIFWILGEVSLP